MRTVAQRTVSTLFAVLLAACATGSRPILDRRAVLDRQKWWDNRDWSWYAANIPFFEAPDSAMEATYYYRWELVTKHLTYGSPETGYTFTEFLDRPFWSGAFGAISCPLGHQFAEIRWLKNPRILDDFARYWFETPGAEPRSYSNWFATAMWNTYLVTADQRFLRRVYPYMQQQYRGWLDERYDPAHRLFHWYGLWDGMEDNIDSRQTADPVSGDSSASGRLRVSSDRSANTVSTPSSALSSAGSCSSSSATAAR